MWVTPVRSLQESWHAVATYSFVLRGSMTVKWNIILRYNGLHYRTTQRAVAARASSTAWEGAPLQVVPRPATPQPCPPGAAPALPVWGRVGAQLMFAGHSHYIPIPTHTNTQPHPHPHPPYPHTQMSLTWSMSSSTCPQPILSSMVGMLVSACTIWRHCWTTCSVWRRYATSLGSLWRADKVFV